MRLDGIALFLVFALSVAYGLIVDLAMFARIFRYRAALVVGSVVSLALGFLLRGQAAIGMDASALIALKEPLGAPDRAALRTLMDRHFVRYSVPHIRVRLLGLDALEPGSFSAQLAPTSEPVPRSVSEEEVPVLLERLEKYGEARFCPGGRMMEADRTALNALVLAKGRVWNVATRA